MAETVNYTYLAPIAGAVACVIRSVDSAAVPCSLDNTDYQAFLAWIAEGNAAPEGWTGPTNPTAPPAEQTPPPAS